MSAAADNGWTACRQTGQRIGFNPHQQWCLCKGGECALVERAPPPKTETP